MEACLRVYIFDNRRTHGQRNWSPKLYDAHSLYAYAKKMKAHLELDGEWNRPYQEIEETEEEGGPKISDDDCLKILENITKTVFQDQIDETLLGLASKALHWVKNLEGSSFCSFENIDNNRRGKGTEDSNWIVPRLSYKTEKEIKEEVSWRSPEALAGYYRDADIDPTNLDAEECVVYTLT